MVLYASVTDTQRILDSIRRLVRLLRLTDRAMERVKGEFQPATWQAFWGTAVDGKPAGEVGSGLKMSPGAVYVAKSRVLARLREQIQHLLGEES